MFALTDATYRGLKKSSLRKHSPSVENSTMLETVTVVCVTTQLITFYLENYAAHREPNNNSNNKL